MRGNPKRAWELGIIGGWYLRDDQLPLYHHLRRHRFPVGECARRFGKTTVDLCVVSELLLQNDSWVWRWCEPWKYQAREIVIPEMEKMHDSCPTRIKPKFYKTDSFFEYPRSGSRLYLRGVNEDRGESSRGSFAHGITADELGSWKEPDYIISEVLLSQILTTQGVLHRLSTPPRDLGHYWYKEKDEAIREGRFLQKIVTDNRSLTKEQIDEFVKAMGGLDSPGCRRELFCEPVADPDRQVIPEYSEQLHVVSDDYPRPPHFDAYVGLDLGFNDCTAVLFGYWDFLRRELVIEDEIVVKGKNSSEIVEAAKAAETNLWGSRPPYLRVSDNDLQQIYDMATLCDYSLVATRKDDRLAAINALRLRFREGAVKIKQRCKNLRFQLKVGLWNESRNNFERGDETGHLDAIAALIYLHRNIRESHNPYPANNPDRATHWVIPGQNVTQEHQALKNAFRPFSPNS